MDSKQPSEQVPTPCPAQTLEQMNIRTRKLMETYLKFPPYVRKAAVSQMAARLDREEAAERPAVETAAPRAR
jgi:hypothetical protein